MKRKNATSNETEIKINLSKELRNFVLEGKVLKADEVTFEGKRKYAINPKTQRASILVSERKNIKEINSISFELVEIEEEELKKMREEGIPYFVLKEHGRLYFSEIPKNVTLTSSKIWGEHKCAIVGKECVRLSAKSDEEGGCEKVRNCSKMIENYPWITIGYETVNTAEDCFGVIECRHYKRIPLRISCK